MDSREAMVALNLIGSWPGAGPPIASTVRRSRRHSGRFPAAVVARPGIGEETADAISKWETTIDLRAELKRIAEFGCRIVTQADAEYPELLRQIYDPPIVL